jgi:hypothetical protein
MAFGDARIPDRSLGLTLWLLLRGGVVTGTLVGGSPLGTALSDVRGDVGVGGGGSNIVELPPAVGETRGTW